MPFYFFREIEYKLNLANKLQTYIILSHSDHAMVIASDVFKSAFVSAPQEESCSNK